MSNNLTVNDCLLNYDPNIIMVQLVGSRSDSHDSRVFRLDLGYILR